MPIFFMYLTRSMDDEINELSHVILEWINSNYNCGNKFKAEHRPDEGDRIIYDDHIVMIVDPNIVWFNEMTLSWYSSGYTYKMYAHAKSTDPDFFNLIDNCLYKWLKMDDLIFPKELLPVEKYGPM